ncbi:tRNA1(Val) A37 N6-methylase TrmN6 [Ochrobactrum intermedium]|uniref:tRNA1(Val) A37 N6-methylase TrmN6 n=1 Tax=Brucella intermedia TaxID=94625 RepID=A0ABR6ARN8_9HYPH|nr:methyltransferase [Brucella intermedia]KAB2713726.1 methyltransferase [Brucella intermedia]MBA8852120.1 tRNA1(Val) A37 N6-methylase TrmN6 [Brucella intermedia]
MNPETENDAGETLDVFHRGAFHLVQPALKGHRSGVDAMILASAVPNGFAGHVADLGSGAGAAGLAVASRCAGATVTLVERSAFMAGFARKSIDHPLNAALADRVNVIEADVALRGKARIAAGLADNSFDFAIMNPPFNEARDRSTPDPLKAEAHVMPEGMFEQWVRTAAAIVKPGGGIAIIARPGSISPILEALSGRFGGLRIVPVQPRPDAAAIRIVVTGIRGSRAGLSLMPALVLHGSEGHGFTPRADGINNGLDALV